MPNATLSEAARLAIQRARNARIDGANRELSAQLPPSPACKISKQLSPSLNSVMASSEKVATSEATVVLPAAAAVVTPPPQQKPNQQQFIQGSSEGPSSISDAKVGSLMGIRMVRNRKAGDNDQHEPVSSSNHFVQQQQALDMTRNLNQANRDSPPKIAGASNTTTNAMNVTKINRIRMMKITQSSSQSENKKDGVDGDPSLGLDENNESRSPYGRNSISRNSSFGRYSLTGSVVNGSEQLHDINHLKATIGKMSVERRKMKMEMDALNEELAKLRDREKTREDSLEQRHEHQTQLDPQHTLNHPWLETVPVDTSKSDLHQNQYQDPLSAAQEIAHLTASLTQLLLENEDFHAKEIEWNTKEAKLERVINQLKNAGWNLMQSYWRLESENRDLLALLATAVVRVASSNVKMETSAHQHETASPLELKAPLKSIQQQQQQHQQQHQHQQHQTLANENDALVCGHAMENTGVKDAATESKKTAHDGAHYANRALGVQKSSPIAELQGAELKTTSKSAQSAQDQVLTIQEDRPDSPEIECTMTSDTSELLISELFMLRTERKFYKERLRKLEAVIQRMNHERNDCYLMYLAHM